MEMNFLNKRNAEKLKAKLTEELEQYIDNVRRMPGDQVVGYASEINKRNQIFEYLINSLEVYDSDQLKSMLNTPDLITRFYKATLKDENHPLSVSVPVENELGEITYEHLTKEKQNKTKKRKPSWFDRISGLSDLDEDEYDYYDDLNSGYFSIPVKEKKKKKNSQSPRKTLKDILNGVKDIDVVTSEELLSLEDTIDLLISFKKHENQQNHEMNKQLNKVLPKLKRMQYQKKFDEEEKQINQHIKNERVR